MAARNPQTQAKRARELALREKRERKKEKKAEAAQRRADGITAPWLEAENGEAGETEDTEDSVEDAAE
jgi:hypothetical protein